MSIAQGTHPRDRGFPGIAALVAIFVVGVASAEMHGGGSLSRALAGTSDPFIAGYTDGHPALPGPYAELRVRHYLAGRDPMTGGHLVTGEPLAPGVAASLLAAIGIWRD